MSNSLHIRKIEQGGSLDRKEIVALLRTKLKEEFKRIGLKEPTEEPSSVNILDCYFTEDDNEILDLAENVKQSVIDERCPNGNNDELNVVLEGAMLAFLSPVLEVNTKTREIAINFMTSILQNLNQKFESKLEKFLRIKVLSSEQAQSVLQTFHNDTTIKLMAKYDIMKKPGSESFQNRYRKQLQEIFSKKSLTAPNSHADGLTDIRGTIQKMIDTQVGEHKRVLSEEAKTIDSEVQLALIHQQSEEAALQNLRKETFSLTSGKNVICFAEVELKQQLYIVFQQVFSQLSTTRCRFVITCQSQLDVCIMKYKAEMRKVLQSKQFCEEYDLSTDHRQISTSVITQFDIKLEKNLQVLKILKEEFKNLLHEKLEDAFGKYNEKWKRKLQQMQTAIKQIAQSHSEKLERKANEVETAEALKEFHELASERMKESFQINLALSVPNVSCHNALLERLSKNIENVYEKVCKEWELQINVSLREVEKAYEEESEKLSNMTFSFNYHDSACATAISRSISAASKRFQTEAKRFLDEKYHDKINAEPIIIGIDFGARYCRSTLFHHGTMLTIPHYDLDGKEELSLVSYVGMLECANFLGKYAQSILQSSTEFQPPIVYDMKNILYYWKNLGCIRDLYNWPFSAMVGQQGPIISGQSFEYPVANIISVLFRKLRENAEKFLNRKVNQCVVVIPHFFDPTQRTNILEAGKIAGFVEITLLEKYNAAALALQFHNMRSNKNETWSYQMRKILLLDFGTDFRFYVVQVFQKEMKLLYVYNWNCRGGKTFHKNLAEYCIQQFIKAFDVSIHELNYDPCAAMVWRRRLSESCTKAMISLSTEHITTVVVSNFYRGKELRVIVTRAKFEEINASIFPSVCEQVNNVLNWAEVGKQNVSEIISTGGYSRIPKLEQVVKNYFNGIPFNNFDSDPEQVMAYGAAIKGAMLASDKSRIKKARSLSSSI
ncbi:unnamed protein product [Orchesella dallaii]|uniref:Uncharacterized protein n=1 Tax=Orchesella dallaii TaxID=48710 RepID=A0ABP1R4C6_9HEXA